MIEDLRAAEPTLGEFSQSLPVSLMRAREAVMARIRPVLKAYGVTELQWRVLRMLAALGETEVTTLADAVFLQPPSLSRVLPDLQRRRLIARRTADADLRRGLVSISPDGLALIAQVAPAAAIANAEIAEAFGQGRMDRLRSLLAELEDALRR